MRFPAIKSILAAVVVTTAALSAHNAKAETTLNVPFSFTVSGQAMPAGVYTVQEDTFHNVVVLRNKAATRSFATRCGPGDPAPNEVHVALKFESNGENHVLRGIQFGSKPTFEAGQWPGALRRRTPFAGTVDSKDFPGLRITAWATGCCRASITIRSSFSREESSPPRCPPVFFVSKRTAFCGLLCNVVATRSTTPLVLEQKKISLGPVTSIDGICHPTNEDLFAGDPGIATPQNRLMGGLRTGPCF